MNELKTMCSYRRYFLSVQIGSSNVGCQVAVAAIMCDLIFHCHIFISPDVHSWQPRRWS